MAGDTNSSGPTLEEQAAELDAAAAAEEAAATAEAAKGGEAPKDGERPAWLPEKFKTVEDMAAAYNALEKKQGTPAAETPKASLTTVDAQKAVEAAGLDMSKLEEEFATNGKLADESVKALTDKGISRETIDQYIEGRQAVATQQRAKFVETAGGERQLAAMLQWAVMGLPADQIEAYNSAVNSGSMAQAQLALAGVLASYTKAVGADPSLVTGTTVKTGAEVYGSEDEVISDISDDRYDSNPAFRSKVDAKLKRSAVFGQKAG